LHLQPWEIDEKATSSIESLEDGQHVADQATGDLDLSGIGPKGYSGGSPYRIAKATILASLWVSSITLPALPSAEAQLKAAEQPSKKDSANTTEAEENRQKEAEEAKRLTELYLRSQTVFIRKGELMLELNSFYNRNSRQDLIPAPDGVAVVRDTRRFMDNTVIARYGFLTDGLEVDFIAPVFIHAEQESDFGLGRVGEKQDGVGDLAAALRYQVWYERGNRPSLVLDVEGKSRTGGTGLTGTGNWNTGGGVTLIKTIDPVVFFGRLGYTHNFASQTRDLGNIFDYRLGMGFSLNDKVSFNIQFTGAYIGPSQITQVAGTGLGAGGGIGPVVFSTRRTEIMNLLFTTTVQVTKNFYIEPVVGVGLTENSFTIIGLRVPYLFNPKR
jgi:hypothetical protein